MLPHILQQLKSRSRDAISTIPTNLTGEANNGSNFVPYPSMFDDLNPLDTPSLSSLISQQAKFDTLFFPQFHPNTHQFCSNPHHSLSTHHALDDSQFSRLPNVTPLTPEAIDLDSLLYTLYPPHPPPSSQHQTSPQPTHPILNPDPAQLFNLKQTALSSFSFLTSRELALNPSLALSIPHSHPSASSTPQSLQISPQHQPGRRVQPNPSQIPSSDSTSPPATTPSPRLRCEPPDHFSRPHHDLLNPLIWSTLNHIQLTNLLSHFLPSAFLFSHISNPTAVLSQLSPTSVFCSPFATPPVPSTHHPSTFLLTEQQGHLGISNICTTSPLTPTALINKINHNFSLLSPHTPNILPNTAIVPNRLIFGKLFDQFNKLKLVVTKRPIVQPPVHIERVFKKITQQRDGDGDLNAKHDDLDSFNGTKSITHLPTLASRKQPHSHHSHHNIHQSGSIGAVENTADKPSATNTTPSNNPSNPPSTTTHAIDIDNRRNPTPTLTKSFVWTLPRISSGDPHRLYIKDRYVPSAPLPLSLPSPSSTRSLSDKQSPFSPQQPSPSSAVSAAATVTSSQSQPQSQPQSQSRSKPKKSQETQQHQQQPINLTTISEDPANKQDDKPQDTSAAEHMLKYLIKHADDDYIRIYALMLALPHVLRIHDRYMTSLSILLSSFTAPMQQLDPSISTPTPQPHQPSSQSPTTYSHSQQYLFYMTLKSSILASLTSHINYLFYIHYLSIQQNIYERCMAQQTIHNEYSMKQACLVLNEPKSFLHPYNQMDSFLQTRLQQASLAKSTLLQNYQQFTNYYESDIQTALDRQHKQSTESQSPNHLNVRMLENSFRRGVSQSDYYNLVLTNSTFYNINFFTSSLSPRGYQDWYRALDLPSYGHQYGAPRVYSDDFRLSLWNKSGRTAIPVVNYAFSKALIFEEDFRRSQYLEELLTAGWDEGKADFVLFDNLGLSNSIHNAIPSSTVLVDNLGRSSSPGVSSTTNLDQIDEGKDVASSSSSHSTQSASTSHHPLQFIQLTKVNEYITTRDAIFISQAQSEFELLNTMFSQQLDKIQLEMEEKQQNQPMTQNSMNLHANDDDGDVVVVENIKNGKSPKNGTKSGVSSNSSTNSQKKDKGHKSQSSSSSSSSSSSTSSSPRSKSEYTPSQLRIVNIIRDRYERYIRQHNQHDQNSPSDKKTNKYSGPLPTANNNHKNRTQVIAALSGNALSTETSSNRNSRDDDDSETTTLPLWIYPITPTTSTPLTKQEFKKHDATWRSRIDYLLSTGFSNVNQFSQHQLSASSRRIGLSTFTYHSTDHYCPSARAEIIDYGQLAFDLPTPLNEGFTSHDSALKNDAISQVLANITKFDDNTEHYNSPNMKLPENPSHHDWYIHLTQFSSDFIYKQYEPYPVMLHGRALLHTLQQHYPVAATTLLEQVEQVGGIGEQYQYCTNDVDYGSTGSNGPAMTGIGNANKSSSNSSFNSDAPGNANANVSMITSQGISAFTFNGKCPGHYLIPANLVQVYEVLIDTLFEHDDLVESLNDTMISQSKSHRTDHKEDEQRVKRNQSIISLLSIPPSQRRMFNAHVSQESLDITKPRQSRSQKSRDEELRFQFLRHQLLNHMIMMEIKSLLSPQCTYLPHHEGQNFVKTCNSAISTLSTPSHYSSTYSSQFCPCKDCMKANSGVDPASASSDAVSSVPFVDPALCVKKEHNIITSGPSHSQYHIHDLFNQYSINCMTQHTHKNNGDPTTTTNNNNNNHTTPSNSQSQKTESQNPPSNHQSALTNIHISHSSLLNPHIPPHTTQHPLFNLLLDSPAPTPLHHKLTLSSLITQQQSAITSSFRLPTIPLLYADRHRHLSRFLRQFVAPSLTGQLRSTTTRFVTPPTPFETSGPARPTSFSLRTLFQDRLRFFSSISPLTTNNDSLKRRSISSTTTTPPATPPPPLSLPNASHRPAQSHPSTPLPSIDLPHPHYLPDIIHTLNTHLAPTIIKTPGHFSDQLSPFTNHLPTLVNFLAELNPYNAKSLPFKQYPNDDSPNQFPIQTTCPFTTSDLLLSVQTVLSIYTHATVYQMFSVAESQFGKTMGESATNSNIQQHKQGKTCLENSSLMGQDEDVIIESTNISQSGRINKTTVKTSQSDGNDDDDDNDDDSERNAIHSAVSLQQHAIPSVILGYFSQSDPITAQQSDSQDNDQSNITTYYPQQYCQDFLSDLADLNPETQSPKQHTKTDALTLPQPITYTASDFRQLFSKTITLNQLFKASTNLMVNSTEGDKATTPAVTTHSLLSKFLLTPHNLLISPNNFLNTRLESPNHTSFQSFHSFMASLQSTLNTIRPTLTLASPSASTPCLPSNSKQKSKRNTRAKMDDYDDGNDVAQIAAGDVDVNPTSLTQVDHFLISLYHSAYNFLPEVFHRNLAPIFAEYFNTTASTMTSTPINNNMTSQQLSQQFTPPPPFPSCFSSSSLLPPAQFLKYRHNSTTLESHIISSISSLPHSSLSPSSITDASRPESNPNVTTRHCSSTTAPTPTLLEQSINFYAILHYFALRFTFTHQIQFIYNLKRIFSLHLLQFSHHFGKFMGLQLSLLKWCENIIEPINGLVTTISALQNHHHSDHKHHNHAQTNTISSKMTDHDDAQQSAQEVGTKPSRCENSIFRMILPPYYLPNHSLRNPSEHKQDQRQSQQTQPQLQHQDQKGKYGSILSIFQLYDQLPFKTHSTFLAWFDAVYCKTDCGNQTVREIAIPGLSSPTMPFCSKDISPEAIIADKMDPQLHKTTELMKKGAQSRSSSVRRTDQDHLLNGGENSDIDDDDDDDDGDATLMNATKVISNSTQAQVFTLSSPLLNLISRSPPQPDTLAKKHKANQWIASLSHFFLLLQDHLHSSDLTNLTNTLSSFSTLTMSISYLLQQQHTSSNTNISSNFQSQFSANLPYKGSNDTNYGHAFEQHVFTQLTIIIKTVVQQLVSYQKTLHLLAKWLSTIIQVSKQSVAEYTSNSKCTATRHLGDKSSQNTKKAESALPSMPSPHHPQLSPSQLSQTILTIQTIINTTIYTIQTHHNLPLSPHLLAFSSPSPLPPLTPRSTSLEDPLTVQTYLALELVLKNMQGDYPLPIPIVSHLKQSLSIPTPHNPSTSAMSTLLALHPPSQRTNLTTLLGYLNLYHEQYSNHVLLPLQHRMVDYIHFISTCPNIHGAIAYETVMWTYQQLSKPE